MPTVLPIASIFPHPLDSGSQAGKPLINHLNGEEFVGADRAKQVRAPSAWASRSAHAESFSRHPAVYRAAWRSKQ
jgi:hypothetical protein